MTVSIDLAQKQTALFQRDNEGYMNALVVGDCIRKIMADAYCVLVLQKKIEQIESLSIGQKTAIWGMAKEISAGRLEKTKLVEFCKALCCLEYFLNLEKS